MARQQFGGNWTETKLKIVEEYLKSYLKHTAKKYCNRAC